MRQPAKLVRVPKHFVQRNLSKRRKLIDADLSLYNGASPCVQPANNLACKNWMIRSDRILLKKEEKKKGGFQLRTLELARGNNLNVHNALRDHGFRFSINFTESTNRSESESSDFELSCTKTVASPGAAPNR